MKSRRRDDDGDADPDGTARVARGNVALQADGDDDDDDGRLRRRQLQEEVTRDPAAQALLHGTTLTAQARDRLAALQADDARPNLSSLSEKQRRALQRRGARKNSALHARLERHDTKRLEAAVAARDAGRVLADTAGCVEAEHDMERTSALTQVQLKRQLDAESAKNIFSLQLAAPHGLHYDRSGRYSVMYSTSCTNRGHVAVMDNQYRTVVTEFYAQERIRDACFLNNHKLFAVAQQQQVCVYDSDAGAQIHALDAHQDPLHLEFLPYHWLLASVGRAGHLKYTDTSTGQLVATLKVGAQATQCLRQNPSNAVLVTGHNNGSVTFWSPAYSNYLAKLLCHPGSPVQACAVDAAGHTLVTAGADRQVCVWDLRMLQKRHAYYTLAGTPTSLDISQRRLLAVGHAGHVTVWGTEALERKVRDPYLHHRVPGGSPIHSVRFRPFEDVCGVGHNKGIDSIVVPGAGDPTFDTNEYFLNPMMDAKQRQEQEVRSLLDKLRPEMIAWDPDVVGGMEESDPHKRLERIQQLQEDANEAAAKNGGKKKKQVTKKRGRSKIQTKLRRKQANIVDQSVLKLRMAREQEKAAAIAGRETVEAAHRKESAPPALRRFF